MKQLNWYQIFGESHKIPDGRTVTPTDDIQIWLHCANIWDKTYTTLEEVLADSTTLSTLISSNNAVDYMVRSTTWATATALVPVMTSDTTPSGECGASSVRSGYDAYLAFNNNTTNGWETVSGTTSAKLYYQFPNPEKINKYSIYTVPSGTRALKGRLVGSNDGLSWTNLEDNDNVFPNGQYNNFIVGNTASYKYYGLAVVETSTTSCRINELQFYSASVVDSSTAMTYIGLNNYCANTLLADATWRTAICNSTYFESVLNVKVPVMTSNTTPSGVCSSNSNYTGRQAYNAFDGNASADTAWACSAGATLPVWVEYAFTSPVNIKRCDITPYGGGTADCRIKNYKLSMSNDSFQTETVLYSGEYGSSASDIRIKTDDTKYQSYRLTINSIPSTASMPVSLLKLQFYGREDV